MTHEHDHSRTAAASETATARDEHEPGRASRTELMRKPEFAIASGLVQRKARDANGVAEGADSAVAAASSSSGSPLPETLQRKFESSLGADLSGVRVHTGDTSAAANDAVGAKAYTMGNDIHFGAGQYDPSSSAGEHLLAHEVAHTVQQSGGAQRMQFKLAVSSPGDSAEHEADRAAEAMVSGAPASVSGATSTIHRDALPALEMPDLTGPFTFKIAEAKHKLGEAPPLIVNGGMSITVSGSVEKTKAGEKVTPGPGKKNPGEIPDTPGTNLKVKKKVSPTSAGIAAELEHKFSEKIVGFTPKVSADGTVSSDGLSIGIGFEFSQAFGPVKLAWVPAHFSLIDWKPGKEPMFGDFKQSVGITSQELSYTFEDGRVAKFSFTGTISIDAGVTPTSFVKWLIKTYGKEQATLLLEQGLGPTVFGALELIGGLAPLLGIAVGAASLVDVIQASARGELEGHVLAGARDTQRAAISYAQMMSGSELAGGFQGPAGPRAMIAQAMAVKDLATVASFQNMTMAALREELKKEPSAYLRVYKETAASAFPAYITHAKEALEAWRDDKTHLDSLTMTDFTELHDIETKVRKVFYG